MSEVQLSGKRRVYEVARELEMDNKAFLAVLKSLNVPDVKNHMSVLTSEDESRVKQHLGKGGGASAPAAETPAKPAVKRRAVVRRRKSAAATTEATPVEVAKPAAEPAPEAPLAAALGRAGVSFLLQIILPEVRQLDLMLEGL